MVSVNWGGSSVGRALRSQCRGRGFDSLPLHSTRCARSWQAMGGRSIVEFLLIANRLRSKVLNLSTGTLFKSAKFLAHHAIHCAFLLCANLTLRMAQIDEARAYSLVSPTQLFLAKTQRCKERKEESFIPSSFAIFATLHAKNAKGPIRSSRLQSSHTNGSIVHNVIFALCPLFAGNASQTARKPSPL
jgi:hypothetical protein